MAQRVAMAMTLDGSKPAEIAADLGGNVTSERVRANLRLARIALRQMAQQTETAQEDGE
jgi:hypothetical protein